MTNGESNRPRFDPTVTFGNLLTVLTIIAAIVVGWVKIETRINALESIASDNRTAISQQNAAISGILQNQTKLTTLMDVYVPKIEQLEQRRR